jgi:hypothetical protein
VAVLGEIWRGFSKSFLSVSTQSLQAEVKGWGLKLEMLKAQDDSNES